MRHLFVAIAFALAGCAAPMAEDGPVMSRIDEPVAAPFTVLEENARVPFASMIRGFRAGPDGALILEGAGNRWYLVELSPVCRSDANFATAIGLIPGPANSIDAFSSIWIDGRRCRVINVSQIADPRPTRSS